MAELVSKLDTWPALIWLLRDAAVSFRRRRSSPASLSSSMSLRMQQTLVPNMLSSSIKVRLFEGHMLVIGYGGAAPRNFVGSLAGRFFLPDASQPHSGQSDTLSRDTLLVSSVVRERLLCAVFRSGSPENNVSIRGIALQLKYSCVCV